MNLRPAKQLAMMKRISNMHPIFFILSYLLVALGEVMAYEGIGLVVLGFPDTLFREASR